MSILDLIFPKSCLECHKQGSYICSDCLAKVSLAKPVCPHCQKPSIDGFTHTKCSQKYGLEGLVSVWKYEGVIRKAILALKYKYSLEVGHELSDALLRYLTRSVLVKTNVLIPIPIYWYRENKRGFNQSEEIGKNVADALGLKFTPDLLIRTKSTRPQVELKGDERRQNLKGVFSINPIYKSLTLNLNSVVLFDDVFTTGSTLHEATKVLKRAGVEKVWGLTISR